MNTAILTSFAIASFFLIHGNYCLLREASPRRGGVIVENLSEVAIIQDIVTVHMDISNMKKLPTYLSHLKKVLKSTESKHIVNTTSPDMLNLVLYMHLKEVEQGVDAMLSQLSNLFMIEDDQGTNNFKRGKKNVHQKNVVKFTHPDLQAYVSRTRVFTEEIETLLITRFPSNTTYSDFTNDDRLIIIFLLKEWIVSTGKFYIKFIEGLIAAREGTLVPFILQTNYLPILYFEANLRWNLKPIEYEGEPNLVYKLAKCYLTNDAIIIILPFQKGQFFILSRLHPFPIAFQGQLLMMETNHDLILTNDKFMYAYPSLADIYHNCKMPFLHSDFHICFPTSFKFYQYQISISCESDVFFGFHSVSSCTYSTRNKFSQPYGGHLGSHYYLYFPTVEQVMITCPSEQPTQYFLEGPYALDDTCSFKINSNLLLILLPGIYTPERLNRNRILENITDLVAFPSSWDTTKLIIVDEESSVSIKNLGLFVSAFIGFICLLNFLCSRM